MMTGCWIVSLDVSVGTLLLHTHNRLLTHDANGSTKCSYIGMIGLL